MELEIDRRKYFMQKHMFRIGELKRERKNLHALLKQIPDWVEKGIDYNESFDLILEEIKEMKNE